MKELNMKPEEIANLVVLSREKGYAIIIPQDALYLVSKAFQKLISQRDAQIAALTAENVALSADNRNYSELLQYHIDRQAKAEAQLAQRDAQIAALTAARNWWKPEYCPVTNRPFFMWIEHPSGGMVPTYGGPYDSYTIPVVDKDGEFSCERYDHDEGAWVDDVCLSVRLIDDQEEILTDVAANALRAEALTKGE